MNNSIKFYMIPISPWSYLSMDRIRLLCERYTIPIEIKPIDLFYIFKKNNIKKVFERPLPIQENRLNELKRWSEYLNIPLKLNPKNFPIDPINSIKLVIASNLVYDFYKSFDITKKICEAFWVKERDISNENELLSIANSFGEDKTLKKLMNSKIVADKLKENTAEALNDKVFGVPSFVYNNKMFWGQDRIFFLEKEIKNINNV